MGVTHVPHPSHEPIFCSHELYDDVTLDDVRRPFHPPMYPTDGESDSDTHLTPTYSVESNSSKLTYPSAIQLTSNSSSSSVVSRALPSVRGHEFIHTVAIPNGRGHAYGGERGDDAPGGFRNGYLPFDG